MAISLSKVSFAYGTPKKKVAPKYVLKDVNIDIDYLLHSKRLEVKHFERAPQSWCYCDELSGE